MAVAEHLSDQPSAAESESARHELVILYDGVCGLCNRWVQFVRARDRKARFRFAALQGDFAEEILGRNGRNPQQLDTLYLVLDANGPNEKLFEKSEAVVGILNRLGGVWKVLSALRVLPRGFRDWCYDRVANRRYRWFGKRDSCPIPRPEERHVFL